MNLTNAMHFARTAFLSAIIAFGASSSAHATLVYDLHTYLQGQVDLPGPLPAQSATNMWTFHFGDRLDTLLTSNGGGTYIQSGQPFNTPLISPLKIGQNAGCSPAATFDGNFMHPGSSKPLGVVFHAPIAGVLSKIEVRYEMVANGCSSNGVTVATSSILSNVSTSIATFTYGSGAGSGNLRTYLPNHTFQAGDMFQLLLGNNGDYNFDHANVNVTLFFEQLAGEGVPAPTPLALLGLGILAFWMTRRRTA